MQKFILHSTNIVINLNSLQSNLWCNYLFKRIHLQVILKNASFFFQKYNCCFYVTLKIKSYCILQIWPNRPTNSWIQLNLRNQDWYDLTCHEKKIFFLFAQYFPRYTKKYFIIFHTCSVKLIACNRFWNIERLFITPCHFIAY